MTISANVWTWQEVEAVAVKQQNAISRLAKSSANVYGLSLAEIQTVCESQKPRQSGGIFWIGTRHEELWLEMRALSEQDLLNKFAAQIQNRRILEAVLGDE